MNDDLTVSDACEQDATAIAGIYAHYVTNSAASFETDPPTTQDIAQRIVRVLGEGYPFLVVRDGAGAVLGYAYAERFGDREAYRFSCETHIYVHKDAVGRGIGKALINALIAACEARGFRQAFAMIAGTEPTSVVLHARAGYLPCGTLTGVGWKQGQWADIFMMQRKLGSGNETLPE
ncbi:GNAT family N-acetyltransferase [uncultured Novosphingobium sp.]|uniref:GNAT family N-acetyltransferase n=1 Tax=uncultured Novosphingobium sp. TaxID=292277 RepID=UPI0025895555|nr:GNAT family N-acetyltransferase [uncultured Novosphingobium sp.]